QFGRVYAAASAVAQHHGLTGEQEADGVESRLGLALLNEAYDRVDDYRTQQHAGIYPVPQQRGDQRRGEHHVQQHIVELQEKASQRTAAFGRDQMVWTVLAEAISGLFLRQTARAGLQLPLYRLRLQCVPLYRLRF